MAAQIQQHEKRLIMSEPENQSTGDGSASTDLLAPRLYLSVEDAKKQRKCRVCLEPATPREDDPFVLDFGDEHAHRECLRKVWG